MARSLKLILWLAALISVSTLAWQVGPLLAVADWRPLATPPARIAVIVVVVLMACAGPLMARRRAAGRNRQLFDALSTHAAAGRTAGGRIDPAAVPRPGAATPTAGAPAAALQARFDAAMRSMRDLQPGGHGSRWHRLTHREPFVNELPWYLFVGSPGSGKTTALIHSGLHFPLADTLGRSPIGGVGGTRHCDWWLTDQAVLIDTAGRYTTQDSNARADAGEWHAFLSLLRRNRPRQPINGALVTVSVSDLLQLPPAELQRQATAVRERLGELHAVLGNRFPVYLLVTKADLLAGFAEFFDNLDREQRAQVWGTTFDPDPSPPDKAKSVIAAAEQADAGLAALIARLRALTLQRLQQEPDAGRRSLIFAYADQLAALQPTLHRFIAAAFDPPTPATPIRGIYFTSGTQEGSPIDRVMSSIARNLALDGRVLPPARGGGKAFFLNRLMTDVVFAEAPLAGTALRWEQRRARIKWSVTASVALAAAVAISAWSVSAMQNRRYVAAVASKVDVIGAALAGTASAGATQGDLRVLLPLYTALRSLASAQGIDPHAPPSGFGYGLYQGAKLDQAARQAYHRLLAQTLAPALAQRLLRGLRAAHDDPGLQYQTLKAYLMLSQSRHNDRTALRRWVDADVAADPGLGFTPDERAELLTHVDALLERNAIQQAVTLDDQAVAQTRAALRRVPRAQRLYAALAERSRQWALPAFRPDLQAGDAGDRLLTRRSGKPLGAPVPALFTHSAWQRGFASSLPEGVASQLDEDAWVLGTETAEPGAVAAVPTAAVARDTATARAALVDEVRQLYLNDYASRWSDLLADLALRRPETSADLALSARLLSEGAGPRRLLMAMLPELTLSDASTGDDAQSAARRADRQFDALRRYMNPGADGNAPIDRLQRLVGDYRIRLDAADPASAGDRAAAGEALQALRTAAGQAPAPLQAMIGTLVGAAENQQQRQQHDVLNASLRSSLFEACQRIVANRYPFSPDSRQDVPAAEFSNLFGPGGLLDTFFAQHLAAQVDTSRHPWRFHDGSAPAGDAADAEGLAQFERAADIRLAFFDGKASRPGFRLVMKPLDMDNSALQFTLDVDGQVLKYAHGPSLPTTVQWPGPGGTGAVLMQMYPPGHPADTGTRLNGSWALLRLFDAAKLVETGRADRLRATLTVDGQKIEYEIATSTPNPLRLAALQSFRCPGRL